LLYGTTKRFLELFGLRHLEELPRAAEFKSALENVDRAIDVSADNTTDSNSGAGRTENISATDLTLEEKSVTTSIRSAIIPAALNEEPLEALSLAARRQLAGGKPISAAKDEDEDEEEEDEDEDDDWEDDDEEDDEEEDDDFVDEEWEEVDDDEEDEDEEDDDEEWDDDEEDDEDWDDDEEEEDEEWEDEKE
jgi:segregation and condensation protein B